MNQLFFPQLLAYFGLNPKTYFDFHQEHQSINLVDQIFVK